MLLKRRKSIWVGVLFVTTFLLALFGFASFIFLNHASAEGASARLNVGVNEVISIAIDADDVSFSITPEFANTKSGTFGMSSTTVKVYTNSDGYKLYLSNKDSDNALSHSESSIADKISSLTVAVAGVDSTDSTDSFPANSWGYSLDTGATKTFSAIPTTTVLIRDITLFEDGKYDVLDGTNSPDTSNFHMASNGPDSNKPQSTDSENYDKLISTTVTFGAKVDTSIASGSYKDIVVFDVTGSNVGPVVPGITTSSYLWTQTATTSIEDVSPKHPIDKYEYYIVKSDKAYSSADEDLVTDASAKAPDTSTTPTGDLTPTVVDSTYSSQLILSNDSNVSTTGVAYTDGIYYVYVRSVDSEGKLSNWASAEIIKLDNTQPSAPEITRTGYNTFSFTSTDNVGTTKYIAVPCVTSGSVDYAQCVASATTPSLNDPSWTTSQSQTISNANSQVWFVYARDEAGNISNYTTIESFKVDFVRQNANMTAHLESATGTEITDSTVYVLKDTPIHVTASATTGYTNFSLTWNGANFTSGNTGTVTSNTEIIASASTTAPYNLEVHRKTNTHNQIEFSAEDDVAVTGYYVTSTALNGTSPANPSASAGNCASTNTKDCWSTNTNFTINGAGTWYVWAKDGANNVTGPMSINAYTVSQGTNTNATSSAKYENNSTGTAWSASENYALNGTTLYVNASVTSGYTMTAIYCGLASGTTSPQSCTISGNISFYATAEDRTAPSAVTFIQTAYNVITLSSTDALNNVTGFYISTSNSTPSATTSGWTSPTSTGGTSTYSYTFSSAGTYYFWAKDSAGNVSAVASKAAHTLTISPTLSTINVQYTNTSGAYVAQNITSSTTRVVIDGTSLYVKASPSTNYTLTSATFGSINIPQNKI